MDVSQDSLTDRYSGLYQPYDGHLLEGVQTGVEVVGKLILRDEECYKCHLRRYCG